MFNIKMLPQNVRGYVLHLTKGEYVHFLRRFGDTILKFGGIKLFGSDEDSTAVLSQKILYLQGMGWEDH